MEYISLDTFLYLMGIFYGFGTVWPIVGGFFLKNTKLLTYPALASALIGSFITMWCAIWSWKNPPSHESSVFTLANLPSGMPQIQFEFYSDRLAALFLALTALFTCAVVLHLIDWLENIEDQPRIAATFNLFILSILLTILANNVYSFLLFQETMTLAFAYLALFRHNLYLGKTNIAAKDMEASKTAFRTYLIFEHIGIILITVALIVIAVQTSPSVPGSASFDVFRKLPPAAADNQSGLSSGMANLVFILMLAGFGIKAGVFPSHIWVPMVHPYSPTSIHAMMSGIALKVAGLYGMYRFFFLLPVEWWWGCLVLILAGVTAMFGVFSAILAKDLKTALASHSVENIGIILAGIGLALVCYAPYTPTEALKNIPPYGGADLQQMLQGLASLALIASLYHLVNHSIFKGLLFFCTGAIENRTGVVAFVKLGGLMKIYPLTSLTFFIGAVSISGFPPFNGFVSEWLLLQTLFSGLNLFILHERVYLLVSLVFVTVCLAMAFALTALAFVKITGEILLGAPRDVEVARTSRKGEVGWHMGSVLIVFAVLCLALGIFSAPVTQQLARLSDGIILNKDVSASLTRNDGIRVDIPIYTPDKGAKDPNHQKWQLSNYQAFLSNRMIIGIGWMIGIPILIGMLARHQIKRLKFLQVGPPWTCGTPYDQTRMQYAGIAFASLIWKPFEERLDPKGSEKPEEDGDSHIPYRDKVSTGRYVVEWIRRGYNHLIHHLLRISEQIGAMVQPGDIRVYLLYIFILFLFILVFLFLRVRR